MAITDATIFPPPQRSGFAAISLGHGVVQLDVTIVDVAIDSIERSFGGGVAALEWVVTACTTAFAALILTAGALGDRIGANECFRPLREITFEGRLALSCNECQRCLCVSEVDPKRGLEAFRREPAPANLTGNEPP